MNGQCLPLRLGRHEYFSVYIPVVGGNPVKHEFQVADASLAPGFCTVHRGLCPGNYHKKTLLARNYRQGPVPLTCEWKNGLRLEIRNALRLRNGSSEESQLAGTNGTACGIGTELRVLYWSPPWVVASPVRFGLLYE